ncbi:hypothetical protein MTO96_001239 [Rhipicephalus appendiculatus]
MWGAVGRAFASPWVDLNELRKKKPPIKKDNEWPSWNMLGEVEPKRLLLSVTGKRKSWTRHLAKGVHASRRESPPVLRVVENF